MATTTSNFGWAIPQSTDLVKDGATAIAALGNGVDTSMAQLKGGTTGQILSKTSNTDMAFTWTTPNPGDITGVTAGTGLSGGGTSGDVTVSFDIANYGGGQGAAGKNALLNSNFSVWQRGTSFSLAASTAYTSGFTADRWQTATGTNQACTISRQATGDTTNLPFIQYALRYQRNSGQTGTAILALVQNFESVNSIPFAGKIVTLSFYARAGANYSAASGALKAQLYSGTGTDQNAFGTYTGAAAAIDSTATLTTTWQRFTFTSASAIPTSATELALQFNFTPVGTASTNDYYEITGVQLELGSTATPYKPNGATQQAELAACQRYYSTSTTNGTHSLSTTQVISAPQTDLLQGFRFPVAMRTAPTVTIYSRNNNSGKVSKTSDGTDISGTVTAANIGNNQVWGLSTSGLTAGTAGYEMSFTASAEL